ncbi:hypothetical protein AAMO2058_001506900 [Amorphochlora amoebiformis]
MVGFLQSLGSRVCHPLPHQQFRVSNTTTITTNAPRAFWDVKHELLLEQSCERRFCLLNKTTALQVNPTTAHRSTQRPPDNTAEENRQSSCSQVNIYHNSVSVSDNARDTQKKPINGILSSKLFSCIWWVYGLPWPRAAPVAPLF